MSALPLAVVVPVYNVEPYLRRCLDSILGQTRPVQEIICVDDGSTDGSLAILRVYEREHANIHVIHKENGGTVSARKAGLACVTCPYVTYVDSDDFLEPQMYETLMDLMLSVGADVVTSGEFRDYGTHVVRSPEQAASGLYTGARLQALQGRIVDTETFFTMRLSLHLYNKIYRTELLRRFQNDLDERISVGEDPAVSWPLLLHARRVYVSGREFYHYCLRNDSVMGRKTSSDAARLEAYFCALKQRLQEVQNVVPQIMMQFSLMRAYMLLLRQADSVLRKNGDTLYPFGSVLLNANVVIYGAGKFGRELKDWLDRHGYHVTLWVDKAQNREGVASPAVLQSAHYDIVLIAALQYDAVASIEKSLQALGVPQEKVRRIEARALQADADD